MQRLVMSGAIALVFVGAGTLVSTSAGAGRIADLRATADSLTSVETVACKRHGRDHCHGAPVASVERNSGVRLDEAGLPDSRRRFSRW